MKYNHAIHLDEKTKEQFEEAVNQGFVLKAALMPDAHLGYVAPIGSVFPWPGPPPGAVSCGPQPHVEHPWPSPPPPSP